MPKSLNLDWNAIRALNGSKQNGFEELCVLLARSRCPPASRFERKGTPDSGVEAYIVNPDETEWAWQAKFFNSMGDSQWSQLDESVAAALAGHPRMNRYTICVPKDLPDARKDGQKSARERWNDRVAKWSELAEQQGMAVEFVWEGSSELLAKLAAPAHRSLVDLFFGESYLDATWFEARMRETLQAAGPRYTPELNVALPLAEQFDAFGRTAAFFRRVQAAAISINERVRSRVFSVSRAPDPALSALIDSAQAACGDALSAFRSLQEDPPVASPLAALSASLKVAIGRVDALHSELENRAAAAKAASTSPTPTATIDSSADASLHGLRRLNSHLEDARWLVDQHRNIVERRLLILTGDAGTGKTHLVCDLAQRRLAAGLPTVVLMGQRFLDASDPWAQALHQLDLNGWTAQEFVGALEVLAQTAGRRCLLIVDALNEGNGTRLWPPHLAAFLARVADSPWIATAITVRSSYAAGLIPSSVSARAVQLQHHGFDGIEFDATRTFFAHYGIDLPSTPLLAQEFRNPLYLKTLCKGLQAAGNTRLPRGFHGVVSAFELHLSGVNIKLSTDLDFDRRTDLVGKALIGVAHRLVATKRSWLALTEAQAIVDALLPGRTYSRSLMAALLNDGLLLEELGWDDTSNSSVPVVIIAYERLSDYLCVRAVLDGVLNATDPRPTFASGGLLDRQTLEQVWWSPGFHEALHILVAERTGQELLALAPDLSTLHQTTDAFLRSLVWRKPEAVTAASRQFLLDLKMSEPTKVIDTLVTVATIPGHPMNAHFSDSLLRETSMGERDAWWSIGLHELWGQQGAVDRLIHWADTIWPHHALDPEPAELIATAIAWLLTTSDRFLRDRATKALVRILTWRADLAAKLVVGFANIDDAYVAERVVAAVYGATMRSVDAAGVTAVADVVRAQVFAGGRPRPHILLREYARGIIVRARHLRGEAVGLRDEDIDPPYASQWPGIPSQAEVDTLFPTRYSDAAESIPWGQYRIRNSVMSDDFGRYVIGTNSWTTSFLSLQLDEPVWTSLEDRIEQVVPGLSGKTLDAWKLFDHFHGRVNSARWSTGLPFVVRGDKAKHKPKRNAALENAMALRSEARQVLLELAEPAERAALTRIVDEMMDEGRRRTAPKFDLALIQRYVVARTLELGWTAERFDAFDTHLTSDGRGEHKAERIGKKYQWIAYREMLAFMADRHQHLYRHAGHDVAGPYRGSWQDNFRDIDPSEVSRPIAQVEDAPSDVTVFWRTTAVADWNPTLAARDWVSETRDVPEPGSLLFSRDRHSDSEWVALYLDVKSAMPRLAYQDSFHDGRREVWLNAEAAVVMQTDAARLAANEFARDLGRSMVDSANHEIFLGEIAWSEAAEHFRDPYHGQGGWATELNDKGLAAVPASTGYQRERGSIDCSIGEESVRMRAPSEELLFLLGARWSGVSATYVDASGVVVCFDPSVNVRSPSTLLVRRSALVEGLRRHDLAICWFVRGEKVDAQGAPDYEVNARRSFQGTFAWDGGNVISGSYCFDTPE